VAPAIFAPLFAHFNALSAPAGGRFFSFAGRGQIPNLASLSTFRQKVLAELSA